ncbi:hypothetical protein CGMCC3_g10545 [Colletotrichum fructicola]|uniref:Uncharacterized protein n=1 Tax=Colletotrichum fructicola (strain Nara gc5) TaxID=1213859 RepID=A0A7J6JL90_COLFN|nr:uncharacterized protein CGMCC3_g10545 [Colletotrichum fructicola]KAE9573260.1 hypothetical protein CGMCC3_g10545 [Colletotrichum fructicola]KAF4427161.1 hypothetical protein CFRS1_v003268 [Colletotrichum fructicola]KAF4490821.1 hypothetical protein CGGC5_v000977 [Colletotrichum fructicola Nara gc5]
MTTALRNSVAGGMYRHHAYYSSKNHRGNTTIDSDTSEDLLRDRRSSYSPHGGASVSETAIHRFSEDIPLLGKPAAKKRIYYMDIATADVSLVCLFLSILVVADENISWHLGVGNYQLIVIGFLLSIMSLCLSSVSPMLFVLLEARFGDSILQNYDAILRNKPLASKLGIVWRVVLILMLALPIGLSVAYKTFTGGHSSMKINGLDYIPNTTWIGMWAPPGITSDTGVSAFFNATTAFREATAQDLNGTEPPLPTFPQPYGYNILFLNETSVAALDTIRAEYVTAIQELLAAGEEWSITAPVTGTVASLSSLRTGNRAHFEESFISFCEEGNVGNKTIYANTELYNYWEFSLANGRMQSDQSWQILGLVPTKADCEEMSHYVNLYQVYRQRCWATWSVTRGGFQLVEGSCDETLLPFAQQQVTSWNVLALQNWYMSPLAEMLITFSGDNGRGNQSRWMTPYMATSVATMLWSRIAMQHQEKTMNFNSENFKMSWNIWQTENGTNLTYEEVGIHYPVDQDSQTILYSRPTLRKSPWLYLVFVSQPVLAIFILGFTVLLYSAPLGRGFGLVSILSGIEPRSLSSLDGASLSGELTKSVKLIMRPMHAEEVSTIKYRVVPSSEGNERGGDLARNVVYH